MIKVQPKEIIETKIIGYFKICIINLELFNSVSFQVQLFQSDDTFIRTECYTLTGNDYLNWSNDDNYIINYVANSLNLVRM